VVLVIIGPAGLSSSIICSMTSLGASAFVRTSANPAFQNYNLIMKRAKLGRRNAGKEAYYACIKQILKPVSTEV